MAAFDVVIVGAGSAGAPMAARLSANFSQRVLLVEAGPDYRTNETPEAIRGPNFAMAIGLGNYHWPNLQARSTQWQVPSFYLCGYGVGGSSAINGQGAVRGTPSDFDRWAAAGCGGWAWHEVLPAFVRLEDDSEFGDRPYHGIGGPLPITRTPLEEWGSVSAALRDASMDLGLPQHEDLNAPDSTGLSPSPWNRRAGRRVSTNDAYLEPVRDRGNLRIEPNAVAERVRFSGSRAIGIDLSTPGGQRFVEAGEVILCAGAIHSPAILMRSGIGPADELRALGLDVVADLPGVGHNLQDHPLVWLTFPLRSEAQAKSLDTLPGHCVLRFSSGLDGAVSDDLEVLPLDRTPMGVTDGGLMVALMQPLSRGSVTLASPSPLIEPIVEFRMLSDRDDLLRLRKATRQAADLARHPALVRIMDATLSFATGQPIDAINDETLDRLLRENCMSYFHSIGTCRMGDPGNPQTVVDPGGRVIGIEGLRVGDASIMPDLPRTPTHLTTVMIAERLSQRL